MTQCDESIYRKLRACVPVYVMIGLPGSGKSTYAMNLQDRTGAEWYNSDSVRELLYGNASIQGDPKEVFGTLYHNAKDDISIGCPVIIDSTNVSKRDRAKLMNTFRHYNCRFIGIVMNTPIEECKLRERIVPDSVIDRMAARYVEPTYDEGFTEIWHITV